MGSPPPPAAPRGRRLTSRSIGSPACQQATRRPVPSDSSGGSSSRQRPLASGQRAAYAHPRGTSAGSTGRPGITASGSVEVGVHVGHRGDERPRVGVPCTGGEVGRGQVLDDPAGVHHQHPVADLADDGDVVADQQQRDVVGRPDGREQVEHLLLHGDVERGGRLVGDDQRGRRPSGPCRSSPAAACRRRTRAGTGAPGAPASAIRTAPQPVDGPGERLTLRSMPWWWRGDLGELAADPAGGVEGGHRVLEHHRQRGARASVAAPRWRRCSRSVPSSSSREASTRPASSTSRETASAVSDLPEPDSPTTPTASPRRTAKLTPADRPDRPVRSREGDLEVADVEHQRRSGVLGVGSAGASAALRRRPVTAGAGSGMPASARRRPRPLATDSPNRLNARPGERARPAPGASAAAGLT